MGLSLVRILWGIASRSPRVLPVGTGPWVVKYRSVTLSWHFIATLYERTNLATLDECVEVSRTRYVCVSRLQ